MLQETPCYERHTQALFLICDRKHDEISPVWKVLVSKMYQCQLSKQWISRARLSKIKQAESLRERKQLKHMSWDYPLHPPFKAQCFDEKRNQVRDKLVLRK